MGLYKHIGGKYLKMVDVLPEPRLTSPTANVKLACALKAHPNGAVNPEFKFQTSHSEAGVSISVSYVPAGGRGWTTFSQGPFCETENIALVELYKATRVAVTKAEHLYMTGDGWEDIPELR